MYFKPRDAQTKPATAKPPQILENRVRANSANTPPAHPFLLIYNVKQLAARPNWIRTIPNAMLDIALDRQIGSRAAAISQYSGTPFILQWAERPLCAFFA